MRRATIAVLIMFWCASAAPVAWGQAPSSPLSVPKVVLAKPPLPTCTVKAVKPPTIQLPYGSRGLFPPPKIEIIAGKRIVGVGESFDMRVIVDSVMDLTSVSWCACGSGIAELDAPHRVELNAVQHHDETWEGVSINRPGTYTFYAGACDTIGCVGAECPCAAGGQAPSCSVTVRDDVSYTHQIDLCTRRYGMSDEWGDWMKNGRLCRRYAIVWETSRVMPTTVRVAFDYGLEPFPYDPPWANEIRHMTKLSEMARLSFPNMNFHFILAADPESCDLHAELGGRGRDSFVTPGYMYLYYETIFDHEFGHMHNIVHHETWFQDGVWHNDLPPGEDSCIMSRNSPEYCSACRAAMGLDLAADNRDEITAIADELSDHYVY